MVDAGPMTAIHQHVKVLSPQGQELLSLLQPTIRGVNQGSHVFGCLIKTDLITFSLDNVSIVDSGDATGSNPAAFCLLQFCGGQDTA